MSLPSDPSQTQFIVADLLPTCEDGLRILEDCSAIDFDVRHTISLLVENVSIWIHEEGSGKTLPLLEDLMPLWADCLIAMATSPSAETPRV